MPPTRSAPGVRKAHRFRELHKARKAYSLSKTRSLSEAETSEAERADKKKGCIQHPYHQPRFTSQAFYLFR